MSTQSTATALTPQPTTPSHLNDEPITCVRSLGDDITAPDKDSPGNGVAMMLGVNGNGAAHDAGGAIVPPGNPFTAQLGRTPMVVPRQIQLGGRRP